jgi:glycosyltransferase involved in cell wall biosynthesis
MSRHVAIVAPYPPAGERHGGHSGVASYTANLAEGLAALDLDVTVLAPELDGDPPVFAADGVTVRRAYRLGRGALPGAARALAELAPDIAHLQWELFLYGGPPSIPGLFPALASMRRGPAPLLTTMHQVVDPAEIDRSYTRLHRIGVPPSVAKAGIASVQRAISIASAAMVVHEVAFTSVLPAATVIAHGIEEVEPADRSAARRDLGLSDRFTVLCFGFLAPYKGLETVLDAAALCESSIEVVVAGGEHPRMAGSTGFGEELRARYGASARFTGWVPDHDVAKWFAAADVAIFPYPKPFSSSGVLALALAYGTPVLLSPGLARCAGAPSVLIAEMEAARLADQLERLSRKPAALDELRRWTSILATGRRWPAIANHHADLYQEVLDVERHPRWRLRAG